MKIPSPVPICRRCNTNIRITGTTATCKCRIRQVNSIEQFKIYDDTRMFELSIHSPLKVINIENFSYSYFVSSDGFTIALERKYAFIFFKGELIRIMKVSQLIPDISH